MKYKHCIIKLYKSEEVFDLPFCPPKLMSHANENNRKIAFVTIRGKLSINMYIEYTGRNKTYKTIREIIDGEKL